MATATKDSNAAINWNSSAKWCIGTSCALVLMRKPVSMVAKPWTAADRGPMVDTPRRCPDCL